MPFKQTSSRVLPGIEAVFEEYEHETGMRHVHVRRNDPERAFVLTFPTPPENDCGIPHILEHLALSGSDKFPVRDPFFSMLRRSLASFINAMTANNHTIYPFATTNENDYWNLMGVYMDATFFPHLHRLDFQQEGWRDTLDENGQVQIQGVVYNEMLGALNSRDARLEIGLDKAWNKGQPTSFVSGGEPLSIPFLSHEELVKFHREHYHPSRAILLTYGDFDAVEAQLKIEEGVLSKREWEHLPPLPMSVKSRMTGEEVAVLVPQEGDNGDEHSITMLWEIDNASQDNRLLVSAMNNLVINEGGPISQIIERADFCRPGPIMFGHEDNRAHFRFELHGLSFEDLDRAKALIREAIAAAITTPISPQQVEAVLRDFEFAERDPGGKVYGMPYGVGKLYKASKSILEGRDPFDVFDNGPALARLRNRLLTPGVAASWLAENMGREPDLVVHGQPDPQFQARYQQALDDIAKKRTAELTPERQEQIRQDAAGLAQRQDKEPDYDLLPGLAVQDLSGAPRTLLHPEFTAGDALTPARVGVQMGSNGQVYMGVSLDMSHVSPSEMRWVSLLTELSSSVGIGEMDWAEAAIWRDQQAVGFGAGIATIQTVHDLEHFGMEVTFDAVGLARNTPTMANLLRTMIDDLRVDEVERIEQVVENSVQASLQGLSQEGHNWSGIAMSQAFSGASAYRARLLGREGHAWVASVHDRLQDPSRAHEVFEGLARAKEHLRRAPIVLRVADEHPDIALDVMGSVFAGRAGWHTPQGSLDLSWPVSSSQDLALAGKTSVQYMRQGWSAPDGQSPDAGNLAVLSKVLSMEFLHKAVREQGGAYGSGANYDPTGSFSMMSYRDPRLSATLDDFNAASAWALSGAITQDMVNSAIISVCRMLDTPVPLAKGAQEAWSVMRSGLTTQARQRTRDGVLGATVESVMAAAQRLFASPPVIRTAFVNEARAPEAADAGFLVKPLAPTPEDISVDVVPVGSFRPK